MPVHVLIFWNNRIHLPKYLISLCISLRYVVDMVGHLIIIIVPTPMTNGMQCVTCIYFSQVVLSPIELSYYMIREKQLN